MYQCTSTRIQTKNKPKTNQKQTKNKPKTNQKQTKNKPKTNQKQSPILPNFPKSLVKNLQFKTVAFFGSS